MRKYPPIDILKLYTTGGTKQWNTFLTEKLVALDLAGLGVMRYRLQAGMDDLAKKKMNSDKLIDIFLRWQRSLEVTAKKILRLKMPNPCDSPLEAALNLDHLEAKRARDQAFEAWLKRTAY